MSARTADNESADAGVAVTAKPPTAASVARAARVRDRGRCESRGRHAKGGRSPSSVNRLPPWLSLSGAEEASPYGANVRHRFTRRGACGSPGRVLDSAGRSAPHPRWPTVTERLL